LAIVVPPGALFLRDPINVTKIPIGLRVENKKRAENAKEWLSRTERPVLSDSPAKCAEFSYELHSCRTDARGQGKWVPPPQRKCYNSARTFVPRRSPTTPEHQLRTKHFVLSLRQHFSFMKTAIVSSVVLVVFALGIQAQPATGGFGSDGRTADGYSIKERGPHHRIWERREVETTPMGTEIERTLSYTELETGMHYLRTVNGRSRWSKSRFWAITRSQPRALTKWYSRRISLAPESLTF